MIRPTTLNHLFITLCLTAYFITNSSFTFAQMKAYGLKLHANYNRSEDGHSFGRLAPALVLKGEKSLEHEFELNRLQKSKQTEYYNFGPGPAYSIPYVARDYALALRYQFTTYLTNKADPTWLPQLGFSVLSSYQNNRYNTDAASAFDRYYSTFDLALAIVPQLRGKLYKRAFFDLALPITPVSYQYLNTTIKDPTLPIRQQRNVNSDLVASTPNEFVENLHVRFGVGLKL